MSVQTETAEEQLEYNLGMMDNSESAKIRAALLIEKSRAASVELVCSTLSTVAQILAVAFGKRS